MTIRMCILIHPILVDVSSLQFQLLGTVVIRIKVSFVKDFPPNTYSIQTDDILYTMYFGHIYHGPVKYF